MPLAADADGVGDAQLANVLAKIFSIEMKTKLIVNDTVFQTSNLSTSLVRTVSRSSDNVLPANFVFKASATASSSFN